MSTDDTTVTTLSDWVAQLRTQALWQLPAALRLQSSRPQLTPRQWGVVACVILAGALELWWRQSALVWLCMLMAAPVVVYVHAQRHPRALLQRTEPFAFAGCHVDVAAQRVYTQGQALPMEVHVHPAQDWSVGVHAVITQRVAQYFIELRHVRRGPVLVLCELVSHTPLSALDVASIDEAVDVMCERLGLRRKGTRLVRAPKGAGAARRVRTHGPT